MKLAIELSNIRVGGGVTHIVEVLKAARPDAFGVKEVIVWGGRQILGLLPDRPWLCKKHEPLLDSTLLSRTLWQNRRLPGLARSCCDILFIPGGFGLSVHGHYVTMSQNLLPFDPEEMARYGASWMFLRLFLLRCLQSRSFHAGRGVIFLSRYGREKVLRHTGPIRGDSPVIPHGISERFFQAPREQKAIGAYSNRHPFRFLYVSTVDVYKHQWHVAEATARLRRKGYPIVLDLIGEAYPPAFRRLKGVMARLDPEGRFIHYHGPESHEKIRLHYHRSDAFVFASTCETFGQVLLEAMAAGLPIACSDREPMTGMVGENGVYLSPEDPTDIAEKLERLLEDRVLREQIAESVFRDARAYSWQRCAEETFAFLAKAAGNGRSV